MEGKITKYKTDADTEAEIESVMLQLMRICQLHKLPFYVSVAVENNDQETKYKNMVYSSTANYINLKDDKIKKYMLVANNYEPVPPREVFEIDMGEI